MTGTSQMSWACQIFCFFSYIELRKTRTVSQTWMATRQATAKDKITSKRLMVLARTIATTFRRRKEVAAKSSALPPQIVTEQSRAGRPRTTFQRAGQRQRRVDLSVSFAPFAQSTREPHERRPPRLRFVRDERASPKSASVVQSAAVDSPRRSSSHKVYFQASHCRRLASRR